jgi:hypothetical protein
MLKPSTENMSEISPSFLDLISRFHSKFRHWITFQGSIRLCDDPDAAAGTAWRTMAEPQPVGGPGARFQDDGNDWLLEHLCVVLGFPG